MSKYLKYRRQHREMIEQNAARKIESIDNYNNESFFEHKLLFRGNL